MRVFRGFDTLPTFLHPAVTVGSYDGVHLGHRAMIRQLVAEARRQGGESIVLTFDPHPRITLRRDNDFFLLTTLDEKIGLLAELGVDNVIVIPFDSSFSALSGAEFIEQHLIGSIGAETLVMGYDHRFGHDRIGCKALTAYPDLRVVQVGECSIEGGHVSSTVIRRLISEGHIADAERLLGHPYKTGIKSPTTTEFRRCDSPETRINPERTTALTEALASLWDTSVHASHTFLSPADIEKLLPAVKAGITGIATLIVAYDGDQPIAFTGIESEKVEMLFVSPEYFGRGIGRKLIMLACGQFAVKYVDVNEQNPSAAGFYRHMGFEVFERTGFDEQGNPFPILKMKLQNR